MIGSISPTCGKRKMASEDACEPGLNAGVVAGIVEEFAERPAGGSVAVRVVRVFPIRISNTSQPLAQASSERHLREPEIASVSSTRTATPLVSASHLTEEASGSGKRYITTRFSHLSVENDDHSVEPSVGQQIYRCEDEPIHIPGAIQRFGALIAVRENARGEFIVRIVSENTENVTSFQIDALFELRCLTDLFPEKHREEFKIRVRAIREDNSNPNQDVFALSLTSLLGAPVPLFCAIHLNEEADLIVCEFEPEHKIFNPTHSITDGSPTKPTSIPGHQAAKSEPLSSTPSGSIPLRSASIARKLARQLGPMELFSILTEIQGHLSKATSLPALLDTVVSFVYELTGFHRTMVYQFDESASGCVVSEHIVAGTSTDTYKGLHFPAADIPKQARDLYMINTIRVLYDREQETARLVCRAFEDAQIPLDLKHSYLRAMSPIHIKYLRNMGVRASMSISLIIGGKLWGLVSCHSYGSGMRVSLPIRELCRGLGSIASNNIEKLIYASQVKARKPLSQPPRPKTSPSSYIAASSSDLLNMFGADFGFLVIKGEARTIGTLLAYGESIALLHYIRKRAFTVVASSHDVAKDYEDIAYHLGFSTISGMMVIPLAASGSDFLVFFRRGRLKEVNWAGNPHEEKSVGRKSNYLEPRSSFKRWTETVIGTSREWTEHQIESATLLSILYGRFIEVWRQKEAIVQKNRMTRLLIQNAGHEVRTPLNSIINYLEVALEETLDEPARHHLEKSLQASKSLVFVVNDLLHLTEAEDADFSVHEDNVDLTDILSEVIAAFEIEAAKRSTRVLLEADISIPWIVICDPGSLRTVLSNLLANAIKHSNAGVVRITLEETKTTQAISSIEISFQDEGTGLTEQQLNNIFQDFERIMDDEETSLQPTQTTPETQRHEIGLGLAITARFVRFNNGQISISSDGEGKGTTVSITLPFRKALQGYIGKRKLSHSLPLPTPPTNPNSIHPHSASGSAFMGSPSPELSISEGSATKGKLVDTGPSNSATPYNAASTSPSSSASPLSPSSPESGRFLFPASSTRQDDQKFTVLVAEDNPLNSQLLETRLRRRGHDVRVAVNGQDCYNALVKSPAAFDVVLMDIQMPLVDGTEATCLIRKFENDTSPSLSPHATSYGRIPIIAVSASLTERSRDQYIDTGFDGWILKPIDFKRLEAMITAIQDEKVRADMLYAKGSWDKGGWFRLKGNDFSGT